MKQDTAAERAFRRRLALLSLLHPQPRPYAEIIAALDQQKLLDYDRLANPETIAAKQKEQFHRDRKALLAIGCQLRYDRLTKCYIWHNSPFGLALNPGQLETLILLLDTFEDSRVLHSARIQALLHYFTNLLPPDQQKSLKAQRRPFSINLHETTDYTQADPINIGEIEKAIRRGQQLEFSYVTPRDGQERRHRIEPRPLVFERGHVYLKGWSLDWDTELPFRLDKLVAGSARMLPTRIAPVRPSAAPFLLEYWLSPVIARQGVSQHFPGQEVEHYPDGSATVRANLTNLDLFEARRLLLSYGANCRVSSPPQLVEQLREIAKSLYQFYCSEESWT